MPERKTKGWVRRLWRFFYQIIAHKSRDVFSLSFLLPLRPQLIPTNPSRSTDSHLPKVRWNKVLLLFSSPSASVKFNQSWIIAKRFQTFLPIVLAQNPNCYCFTFGNLFTGRHSLISVPRTAHLEFIWRWKNWKLAVALMGLTVVQQAEKNKLKTPKVRSARIEG